MTLHPKHSHVAIIVDGNIMIWDYFNRQQIHKDIVYMGKGTEDKALEVKYDASGTQLIAAGAPSVMFFSLESGPIIRTITLRAGYRVAESGLLGEDFIVARTGPFDCGADLVLVKITNDEPQYQKIDTAPGCKQGYDPLNDAIWIYHDHVRGRLYTLREGVPGIKIWDVATSRHVDVDVSLSKLSGPPFGINGHLKMAAVLEGDRIKIVNMRDETTVSEFTTHGQWTSFT
jgi:hypothetical protein